jgi:predicted  nucleic acid-binding Zn-ribbon protein
MRGLVVLSLLAAGLVGAEQQNPITRVVELMQGLVKKIDADGKAEEDLFDTYVCWYKTVVSTKKASNEKGKDRIEALSAYIDDIKSGRVEFTSERKDLETEIAKLNTEIEGSNAMREKEHDDFLAAKDEMEKAISALEGAVETLGSATEDHTEGVLTSYGFDLRRAVELGKNFLSQGDVRFLEHTLDGDVPEADWKKLNRKATFKMAYKARSFKIQEILADMLQTFRDNLSDATKKENNDQSTYMTLKGSKESQLSAAQDALSGGDGESGARGVNAQEAQDEVDALTTQVSNDEKYIGQAEDSYAIKVTEWKERKRLRTGEAAAVSKAMAVLTSDDARDTFSSSHKSQVALFLQEGVSASCHRAKAVSKLRETAAKHNDMRLAALAILAQQSSKGHFDEIVESIDKMASDLKAEYEEDLKTKESCEADRMTNTKIAKQNAQNMDDQTALIARKQAEIDTKQKEVEDIIAHVKELRLQIEEAQINRRKEKVEYDNAKADDEAAAVLVQKSMDVLAKFYEDEALAFVQKSSAHQQQPPEMTGAGEAPPPPPSTFSQPYGGATGESNGIQSIMGMIKDDIAKDIRTATDGENKAISDFNTFNSETEAMISSLESEKTSLQGEIGSAEDDITSAKSTRDKKKGVLDDTLDLLKSIAPGCDFMAVNFELRKANRESEIDGLYEAKASLQGGSFKFLQKSDGC